MYFGSVKFFKHLILSVLSFILAALIGGLVTFIVLFTTQKNKTEEAMAMYNESAEQNKHINIPDGSDLEDIYDILRNKGYTDKDIIDIILKNDANAADYLEKKRIEAEVATGPEYMKLYPELYAGLPEKYVERHNTIYLTFDDGPSQNTLQILSILDKYNIKATFFMCGSETEEGKAIMKKVAEKGHTIGVHSYSHDYEVIYKDMNSFLDDFNKTYNLIYDATGVKPDIFRFAGGSINNYNRLIYKQIISEMTRRGFTYYDWNVSGEDANANATWTSIYRNVLNGVDGKGNAIVLLHDTKERTVYVVEDLIQQLLKDGYQFEPLTNEVEPFNFSYLS